MSNRKLKKYEREIQQLLKKRTEILARFFTEDEVILGSYRETHMRCGSPGCHCQNEGGHKTMRISYREKGKLKNKIVRIDDREWVEKASVNYRQHKQALKNLADVNVREKEVLKLMIELKAKIYE